MENTTGQYNKKIGMVLGSGGARGLTHIGVLKAVEEEGLRPSHIAGCSIGALIGALYATGMPVGEIEELALQFNWKLFAKLFSPSFPLSSFVNDKFLTGLLYEIFGDRTFSDLNTTFSAVATDIRTGRMVVFEHGDLLTAVRASIAVPVIFSPVTSGRMLLVDGGLVNPLPVDVARKKDVNFVIAVNHRNIGPYREGKNRNGGSHSSRDLTFLRLLYRMFVIVQVQIADYSMKLARPDILIEPDTGSFKAYNFGKAKELIEIGYVTAKSKFKELEYMTAEQMLI